MSTSDRPSTDSIRAASPIAATDATTAEGVAPGPPSEPHGLDLAVVIGTLSSDPVVADLPSGSVMYRYEVTARHPGGTDTVPVVWFDPARPPRVTVGDAVAVTGRVRRRFYRAGGATRSSTEIVAAAVSRASNTGRLAAALRSALATVDASG